MRDFKIYNQESLPYYIKKVAVTTENEPPGSSFGPCHLPYHVLGFVTNGSGIIRRTDNIFNFRTVFNDKNIKMYIQKQGLKEVELYNTEKDISFFAKKEAIPTHNGTVGIYSNDVDLYVKDFKITLNDRKAVKAGTKYTVQYTSPAIPALIGETYHFKDFYFNFSSKSASISGKSIQWETNDKDVIIKNGTFKVLGIGIYTLYATYHNRTKKFFIVTKKDALNNFVLFSFKFKDWNNKDNPFVAEQHFDRLPIKSITVIKEGPFKDFTYFNNGMHIPFVIKLNSDTVKHFSNYTLSCEMFTSESLRLKWKRIGFITRLNQKNKSVSKSEFCAATYTQYSGAFIETNKGLLTNFDTRTCEDNDLLQIQTQPKADCKSNYKINAATGRCFYLSPNSDYYFIANKGTAWKFIWVGFETNLEIPDYAYKREFTLSDAEKIFTNIKNTNDQKFILDAVSQLIELLSTAKKDQQQSAGSISQKVKLLISNTSQIPLNQVTVESTALRMNISRNYLSTVFKNETGITLQKYISDYKLDRASQLLRTQGSTINKVAERLGYTNKKSFIVAFKKKHGLTPTQYLKSSKIN